MSRQLFTLTEMAAVLDVSENMDEAAMNKKIRDAQDFDFDNMLPSALREDLYDLLASVEDEADDWDEEADYEEDDLVLLVDENSDTALWRATTDNTDSLPSSGNDDWERIVLYDVWNWYLKPYLMRRAYDRFLTWHGRNVAQDDIVQVRDENRVAVTDKGRAEMKNDIKNQAEIYFSRFMKYMDDNSNTIDGTEYSFDSDEDLGSQDDGIILRAI